MIAKAKHHIKTFTGDSLYRNSLYLMMSTGVLAVFGFLFWIICARIYSPQQIGIATTLISVTALITNFSVLGLTNGLIRYLPTSEQKNDKINTSLNLILLASLLFSIIYILGVNFFSPKLSFLQTNPLYMISFIGFNLLSALTVLFDSVFIAYRSASYILIKSTLLSLVKLALPFALVGLLSLGIFLSYGIAIFAAVSLSLIFLLTKFKYIYSFRINKTALNKMMKFAFANYIAGFIGSIPFTVLPLLILEKLGTVPAAYFSMDMMVANILYIIPGATSQSLFAEGSHEGVDIKKQLIKSLKINYTIITPAILAVVLIGKYILLAFGKNYSSEGEILLIYLALAGLALTISNMTNVLLFIKHKMKMLILLNVLTVVVLLTLSYAFIGMGLTGIGMAWLLGQAIMSVFNIYLLKKYI